MQNILVNQIGVGNHSGKAVLRQCKGSDGSNEGMNFVVNSTTGLDDSDIYVPVISIDDYCHQKQISRIDIMKMDIEGGEYDALVGAKGLVQNQNIKCLFLELSEWAANRSGYSTIDIKRMLLDAGYNIYRLRLGKLTAVQAEEVHNENVIAFARDFNLP